MRYFLHQLVTWKIALRDIKFLFFSGIAVAYCLVGLFITPIYFEYIQTREAIAFQDPVLLVLPSLDVSFFIFNLMNVCALFTLIWLLLNPKYLAMAIMTWALVFTFRYLTIFLLNLDTPQGYIKLDDPLLDGLVYEGKVISKDLFFSGHTAYMFMLYLVVENSILKRINLIGSLLVGILLLIQHNHYLIDIVAAPFFAWVSFVSSRWLYLHYVK